MPLKRLKSPNSTPEKKKQMSPPEWRNVLNVKRMLLMTVLLVTGAHTGSTNVVPISAIKT